MIKYNCLKGTNMFPTCVIREFGCCLLVLNTYTYTCMRILIVDTEYPPGDPGNNIRLLDFLYAKKNGVINMLDSA